MIFVRGASGTFKSRKNFFSKFIRFLAQSGCRWGKALVIEVIWRLLFYPMVGRVCSEFAKAKLNGVLGPLHKQNSSAK